MFFIDELKIRDVNFKQVLKINNVGLGDGMLYLKRYIEDKYQVNFEQMLKKGEEKEKKLKEEFAHANLVISWAAFSCFFLASSSSFLYSLLAF